MSFLETAWRFLTFQPAQPQPLQVREALSVRPISSQLNRPNWPRRNAQTYTDEAYVKLALIFRCIGVLSQSVASAPLRVYLDKPDGEEDIPAHPLRQLLTNPNRETNEARFISQVMMTMAVAGFCVIEKERAAAGRVVGLWPINPAYCKPILRLDALPDWEIRVPGYDPVILNSTDVIALTFADRPDQVATGIGPIEVVLREAALLNIQTDFLKSFFDQGAMPVYALIPRKEDAMTMTQAEADVIREKWRQRYGGMSAANEPAILAGIEDVRRLSFDFDELAYTDLRDLSDLAICQAFGIPPILVGSRFGLERSTFANYKEARRSFYEDTVSPLWNRIEDAFQRGLLRDFERRPNYRLAFDASDVAAMREDVLPRWQWAVTALNAGGISTHQFARICDLEPAGTDVFLRGFAVVEVPVGRNGASARHSIREAAPRALSDGGMEKRARIGQANRDAYLRIATQHEPKIRRFLDEQKERMVGEVNRERHLTIETRDVSDIDWFEEDRLLHQIIEQLQMAAGQVAFQLASQALGVDSLVWTLTNPNIMRLVDELGKRITGINETTRLDISKIVTESLTEGVSMDELAGRLEGLFENTYNGRAMTISRTESQVAYNEAAALGYQESGVVRECQLFDNSMHDTDPGSDGWTCADRNGQIVPLSTISRHIAAEHPNGTLAIGPVVSLDA